VLPLLRRTFATFPPAERRQLGEKIRRGATKAVNSEEMDWERGEKVLPIVAQLLGLKFGG
ncbi:MAG: hypothetical protein D6728_09800, partial [Cyanobacteria bacterium J055]